MVATYPMPMRKSPTPPKTAFARRFSQWMAAEGLKPQEVAEVLGLTPTYIRMIARGDGRPGWKTLQAIFSRWDVPREEWLADAGFGSEPVPDERAEIARLAAAEAIRLMRAEESDYDPDAAFMEGVRQIKEELGEDFEVSTEVMPLSRATPEEIEAMLAVIRARLLERREQKKGEK